MPEMTFAYGMNMYPETMPPTAAGQAAWLPGYRLAWRGFADVEEHEGGVVPGVLWEFARDEDLWQLDRREGVPHLYRRQLLTVVTADAEEHQAWVYRMTDDTVRFYGDRRLEGLGTCSDNYLDMVARGRRAFGHGYDDVTLI